MVNKGEGKETHLWTTQTLLQIVAFDVWENGCNQSENHYWVEYSSDGLFEQLFVAHVVSI